MLFSVKAISASLFVCSLVIAADVKPPTVEELQNTIALLTSIVSKMNISAVAPATCPPCPCLQKDTVARLEVSSDTTVTKPSQAAGYRAVTKPVVLDNADSAPPPKSTGGYSAPAPVAPSTPLAATTIVSSAAPVSGGYSAPAPTTAGKGPAPAGGSSSGGTLPSGEPRFDADTPEQLIEIAKTAIKQQKEKPEEWDPKKHRTLRAKRSVVLEAVRIWKKDPKALACNAAGRYEVIDDPPQCVDRSILEIEYLKTFKRIGLQRRQEQKPKIKCYSIRMLCLEDNFYQMTADDVIKILEKGEKDLLLPYPMPLNERAPRKAIEDAWLKWTGSPAGADLCVPDKLETKLLAKFPAKQSKGVLPIECIQ